MSEQPAVIKQLYDHLLQISVGETAAAGGPPSPPRSAVLMSWPGWPIDPALYSKPFNPATRQGNWQAVEMFSSLVDISPVPGPYFVPTNNSIETAYQLLLESTAEPAARPGGDHGAGPPAASPFTRELARAKEAFSRTGVTSLDGRRSYHPSSPAPLSWCDADADSLWQSISFEIGPQSAPQPTLPAPSGVIQWQPSDFSNTPVWRLTPRISLPPAGLRGPSVDPVNPFANPARGELQALGLRADAGSAMARDMIGSAMRANLASPSLMHPAFAVAAGAAGVGSHVSAFPHGGTFDPIPDDGRPDFPPVTPHPSFPPHTTAPPPSPVEGADVTTKLTITFKFIRVSVARIWFDNLLLALPGWHQTGLPRGFFSTGAVDRTNIGQCPLIPTSFLAIKNLAFLGSWSAEDGTMARRASSGQEAGALGPFTLSAGSTSSSFDGTRLSVSGVQIVTWTANAMPLAPPA